jgi:hypothetical protein
VPVNREPQPAPILHRDNVLLISAIALLAVAVGLTFAAPPGQSAGAFGGDSTVVAAALPSGTAAAATPTVAALPRRERPTLAAVAPAAMVQRQSDDGYPEPYPQDEWSGDEGDGDSYPYPDDTNPDGFSPTVIVGDEENVDDLPADGEAAGEDSLEPEATVGGTELGSTPQNLQATIAAFASALSAITPTPTVTPLPTATPLPTTPPAIVLTGSNRWSAAQSPIILDRDVVLAPNAELIIEPGVEIRLATAASIYLDAGRLLAVGSAEQPIVFTGATAARWGGLFARPGAYLALEHVEIRGGGIGGTVLLAEEAGVVWRFVRIHDNGGGVIAYDALLRMESVEIAGNDVPYGAALDISYVRGNGLTLIGNRIGGNRLGDAAPMVRISSANPREVLSMEVRGNLIRGGSPNLALNVDTFMQGDIVCNTLVGGGPGISLRSANPQVGPNGSLVNDLRIARNLIDDHVPPIEPVYLTYGLGRGAVSDVGLNVRNNFWGDASGPYHPDLNPDGRGDSVGRNLTFIPWLTEAPACAPAR